MAFEKTKLARKRPSQLIERAGLHLVQFQLARRGMEFTRTEPRSASGDIWAEAAVGRISIEVKTTDKSNGWFVSRRQHSSEIYCLVHSESARCWVMTSNEMAGLLAVARDIYDGAVAAIKIGDLPREALEAWDKIGGGAMQGVYRISKPTSVGASRANRVVKHTLKDGTEKVYRYDGWVRGKPRSPAWPEAIGAAVSEPGP